MRRVIAFILLVWCSACWAADREYIQIPSSSSPSSNNDLVSSLKESFPGCTDRQTVFPDVFQTTACYEGYSVHPYTCSMRTEVVVDKSSNLSGEAELRIDRVSDPCPLQGHCEVGEYQCVEGPETRIIDGIPVHQSCWRWDVQYQCVEAVVSTCSQQLPNCRLLSQRCVSWSSEGPNSGNCDVIEKQYQCPIQSQHTLNTVECGSQLFQVSSGRLVPYIPPAASLDTLSYDQVLAVSSNSGVSEPKALNMSAQRRSLNFAPSSATRNDSCHHLGVRCTKRVMGICTQVEEVSCCSSSRIGLAANEFGRAQIGKGWGSFDAPQCEGFSQEEWLQIDWSLIDTRFFPKDMLMVAPLVPPKRMDKYAVTYRSYYDQ